MSSRSMQSPMASSDHSCYFLHLTFFILVLRGDGAHDYKDALEKSITFFQGQRSGKLPPPAKGQDINWRADSALKDGQKAGLDLTGGYYDAGDNDKFNYPMAFTTTMLSWSAIEFGKNMGDDQSERAREAIRWATDYLLKSSSKVASSGVLYVGVGNGDTDHSCWERPEDIDDDTQGGGAYRDVYSVSASNRGGDIAGETAAALAAASIVFRNIDRPYSRKLLATAKDVMQFAMTYRGGNTFNYYPSYLGEDKDEMLWAAAWLLRATRNDNKYLNYIRTLGANDDVDLFSWENKYAGAYVLLSRRLLVKNNSDPIAQEYSKKVETFMCKILSHSYSTSSNTQYTPGGLLYKNEGGSNLQYVTSITFLMTAFAKYMASMKHTFSCGSPLITSKVLRDLAKAQVDYILGDNPNKMSYMVGYGNRYPQRIHHRGSSILSIKALPTKLGCHGGDSYRSTQNPNPNILTGAIVGGPGGDDGFEDSRANYAQSEPTTYINAPLVGTLAYIAGRQK